MAAPPEHKKKHDKKRRSRGRSRKERNKKGSITNLKPVGDLCVIFLIEQL